MRGCPCCGKLYGCTSLCPECGLRLYWLCLAEHRKSAHGVPISVTTEIRNLFYKGPRYDEPKVAEGGGVEPPQPKP